MALREVGVPEKNIYVDKKSGKDFERANYQRLTRNQREGRGHCRAGYALVGYPKKSGSHRDADRRHRFAIAQLCGSDGAGVYSSATGGGHRRGESAGRAFWASAAGAAEGVPRRASGVAEKGDLRAGGRTEIKRYPQNISQMGA